MMHISWIRFCVGDGPNVFFFFFLVVFFDVFHQTSLHFLSSVLEAALISGLQILSV